MSNDTELKPCPFCGSQPQDQYYSGVHVGVFCPGTGCPIQYDTMAITEWNTRPTPSDSVMVNRDDLAAYLRAPHMGKVRNRLALALVHTTEGEG